MKAEALLQTRFYLPGQVSFYKGKVRDVYNVSNQYLTMVVTDRISAFDIVLPKAIPFKGQVLNQIASHFLDLTSDIVPNWKIATPDPMVTIGKTCKPFPIEMIIRGYLVGSAWRAYKNGARNICGVSIPDGMKENDAFPEPIVTPTTKAETGHDEDISKEEILNQGLISPEHYEQIENYTRKLFKRGSEIANQRGLILVDTKYEFGESEGKVFLIDEIHTPDSSRYFYLDDFRERIAKGLAPRQLSKEFVREWLMEKGFQGKPGQKVPVIPDEFVAEVSERYIELYEQITGQLFERYDTEDLSDRIELNILRFLAEN
jgi:phosphoribosylaminoimidazole-succinocarboxamide synthase